MKPLRRPTRYLMPPVCAFSRTAFGAPGVANAGLRVMRLPTATPQVELLSTPSYAPPT